MALANTGLSVQTIYCTKEKLDAHAATPGSIYYTTDTYSIYVDKQDGVRICYDSVICVADDAALESLAEAYTPSTEKLYFVESTKHIHIWNGADFVVVSVPPTEVLENISTSYGVEVVSELPETGETNKIYIVPATDALDGITKNVYFYTGTGFVNTTPSKTAVKTVSDEGLVAVLQAVDTKLAAIKLDFTNATGSTTLASIEQTLSSYYTKAEVYNRDEVDMLIAAGVDTASEEDKTSISIVSSKGVVESGAISLAADVKTYEITLDTLKIITINADLLGVTGNTSIDFQLVLSGLKTFSPVFGTAITWISDEITTEKDNALITLKSIDNGSTWLAKVEGYWD